jgi:hypothetical protein
LLIFSSDFGRARKMSDNNDYWLDMEIQPAIIASLIRRYNRYCEVDSRQLDHEIMSFKDFVNQIIVRGLQAYEPMIQELEKELHITESD